jgi:hypothetical protein
MPSVSFTCELGGSSPPDKRAVFLWDDENFPLGPPGSEDLTKTFVRAEPGQHEFAFVVIGRPGADWTVRLDYGADEPLTRKGTLPASGRVTSRRYSIDVPEDEA